MHSATFLNFLHAFWNIILETCTVLYCFVLSSNVLSWFCLCAFLRISDWNLDTQTDRQTLGLVGMRLCSQKSKKKSWNCMQAHETACYPLELHISSWNFMQAQETACKPMDLHTSMHSGTFWKVLHAFWNVLHALWNILEPSETFAYKLEGSACILECSACILDCSGTYCMHSGPFWNILHAF